MDYESRLSISFYREVATINQEHHIFLVQHLKNHKFYVKKILDVFHTEIYRQLKEHPVKGIPPIYELCEEDGKLIIIEEYISGETFDEYITAHGTLSNAMVADYIIQLCDILSQLHHLSPAVIHRDIKPSNVMITPYGNVVLLDLNTAKYVDSSKNADTMLLGTQGYAAPEQYGFGSSNIQTDIYGVGVLLNMLLTGKLPGNTMSDGPFSDIIKKSTQLRPDDRYQSIDDLKHAILDLGLTSAQNESSKKHTLCSLLPPGYRGKNLFHMLLATFGYAMVIYIGCTLTVENATPAVLLIERIFFTTIFLLLIFFSGNYRNVQHVFPFCTSKNKLIRLLAIVVYDILIFLTMIILMSIVETFFM